MLDVSVLARPVSLYILEPVIFARMSADITEFLEAWDLLESDQPLSSFSLRDWNSLIEGLENLYKTQSQPVPGSIAPGLFLSNRIVSGEEPITGIVPHLLTANCVWFPDPLYSFLTKTADTAWGFVPDSGSTAFGNERGPTSNYRTIWSVNPSQRPPLARAFLPKILGRIRELSPLIKSGAIHLLPWEPIFLKDRTEIAKMVASTKGSKAVREVTELHKQGEYTLGIRAGAFQFVASDNPPPESKVPPGDDRFYFVDKVPSLVYGYINTSYTVRTGGSLALSEKVIGHCTILFFPVPSDPSTRH
jgi:hypothetical protein